jgi:hypothetical protein
MFVFMAGGCGGGGGFDGEYGGGGYDDYNPSPAPPSGGGSNPSPTPPSGGGGSDPSPAPPGGGDASEILVINKENVLVENVVPQPNVRKEPVPEESLRSLSFAEESDRASAIAPKQAVLSGTEEYKAGEVIVASPSEETGPGFAAVVESVQKNPDGTQTLTLRQARIDDIFESVDLFFSLHATPSSYAASAASRGAVSARADTNATWNAIWQSFVNGTQLPNLPEGSNYKYMDITLPPDNVGKTKLDAAFSEIFRGSTKMTVRYKLKAGFALLLSARGSAKEVAVHFPYRIEIDNDLELKGGIEKTLFEKEVTPEVKVYGGFAWVPLPFPPGAAVPIPWTVGASMVFEGKAGLESGLDVGYNTVWLGDAGFVYDDGGFKPINPTPKSAGGGGLRGESVVAASYGEFGFGPKLTLDVCAAPFTSIKSTVGVKFETDWANPSAPTLDGKFRRGDCHRPLLSTS